MAWSNVARAAGRLLGRATKSATRPAWRGVEPLEERLLMATQVINAPNAPIFKLIMGDQLDFQIGNANNPSAGQVFPSSSLQSNTPGDAGFFVRIGGQAYGHTGGASGGTKAKPYTPVSHTLTQQGNVWTDTTVVSAGGLQITQTTTFKEGDEFFLQTESIQNTTNAAITFDGFAAADIYLAGSDYGVGFRNAAVDAIGGTDETGTYHIFNQPAMTGLMPQKWQEAFYYDIWAVIGGGATSHFNNTALLPTTQPPYTNDPNFIDNGAGHEWQGVTVQGGRNLSISFYWAFGNLTAVGLANLTPAPPLTVTAGQQTGQTVGTVDGSPTGMGQLQVFINWGDGTTTIGTLQQAQDLGNNQVRYNITSANQPHLYRRPGTYQVTFQVGAAGGTPLYGQTSATVSDTTGTASGQPFAVLAGQPFTTTVGEYVDQNPFAQASDFTVMIDWGDGSTPTAGQLVAQASDPGQPGGARFDVVGSHTYADGQMARGVTFAVYDANGPKGVGVSSATVQQQRTTVITGHTDNPWVSVLNDQGMEVQRLAPFAGWTGGLNVASGDVTGDGVADIIVAPSVGGAPVLVIYDGATLQPRTSFPVFDLSGRGGYTVAAGDTNGDGIADIVVGEETGTHVRLLNGQDGSVWWDFTPAGFYLQRPTGTSQAFVPGPNAITWSNGGTPPAGYDVVFYNGGIHVAMGDLNGDGHADIIVAPNTGRGTGGDNFAVPISYYSGYDSQMFLSYLPYGAGYTGGIDVAAGDVTNDGRADVVVMANSGPAIIGIHDIAFGNFATVPVFDPSAVRPVYHATVSDLNLDGVQDLVFSGLNATTGQRAIRALSGGTWQLIYTVG